MLKVLTAEQMREVDRLTTERYGIPSILLMENAAHAVARVITEKLGGSVKGKSILILCGKGNNGGDGAALARILMQQGAAIELLLFSELEDLSGDALINFNVLRNLSGDYHGNPNRFVGAWFGNREIGSLVLTLCPSESEWLDSKQFVEKFETADMVVDAILGTGLTREVKGLYENVVSWVNELPARIPNVPYVLSVDIPSGLNADSGLELGKGIVANGTVTFGAAKPGNVLTPAAKQNGELTIADIGLPGDLIDEQDSQLFVSEALDARTWLENSAFSTDSYKNKRGHTLIVAGSQDYSGAAVLAANSAMRSGVGLTTLMVPDSVKAEVAARVIPEVIVKPIAETAGELSAEAFITSENTIRQADSILVGPGLSATDPGGEKLVREIVESRRQPVIVDAGALWFFNPPNGLLRKPAREQGRNFQDAEVRNSLHGSEVRNSDTSGPDTALADARASASAASEPRAENHPVGETPTPLVLASEQASVAGSPQPRKEGSRAPIILTPHEGEFLRLLGRSEKLPNGERVDAVREYCEKHGVYLILKGERVLTGAPDGRVVVNPTGNSGVGKAGNGDTLAGLIAGFVAQSEKLGIDIFETLVAAVYIAGMAADIAERKYGKRVMTASDVRESLSEAFTLLEDTKATVDSE